MKKIVLATNNKKLEEKIKQNDNIKIECNNLQYREAILEILEKNKKIDFILISENLPGIISIENLIKKIKIINNKINIIFFLEKEDTNKKNKLKKLEIENIYLNKKININKILNLITKNNYEKENKFSNIKIEKDANNKIINLINLNKKENALITIIGKRKSGKSTITNLLLIYLLEKNKKILLINLNKKIENNYLILFRKKYYKNKNRNNFINNKINKKNLFLKSEIKIENNLIFLNNFQKIIKENNYNEILEYFTRYYIKKYDYILVDIGNNADRKIREEIIKRSDKNIAVIVNDVLGIKEFEEFVLNLKQKQKDSKKSLHIILNKYYFDSISKSIFQNIVSKKIKLDIVFFNKKFKNIQEDILKNKKVKINLFLKNKFKNILNLK